jgi:endonuclease/exonuclease/phosphatase (EEP) superfamily protein YafD
VKHRQWGGAVLGLFVGMCGLVAGRLGQLYPSFDVFAQFGFQFFVATLAFTFAMFFPRYKTLLGIAMATALLALYSAWPHIASNQLQGRNFKLETGEQVLRISHFNTFKNNFDYDAIAEEVLRLDADVVSLLELSNQKKKLVLPKLLEKYPYQTVCDEADHCQQAIVSKFPFAETASQSLWEGPPYIMIKLGSNFQNVAIYSVHTTRFPYSRAQLKQVRALTKILENTPGAKIIMGDFNATVFSRVLSTLETSTGLTRITSLPTWPAQLQMPQLAIDHIFISDNFRVIAEPQIGASVGSDHFPILATLALKPKN